MQWPPSKTESYLLLLLASHVLQALQNLHLIWTHRLHLALKLGPAQGYSWNQGGRRKLKSRSRMLESRRKDLLKATNLIICSACWNACAGSFLKWPAAVCVCYPSMEKSKTSKSVFSNAGKSGVCYHMSPSTTRHPGALKRQHKKLIHILRHLVVILLHRWFSSRGNI